MSLALSEGRGFSILRLDHLGTTCTCQAGVHNEFEAPLLHEPIFRAFLHARHDCLNPAFGFLELSTPLADSPSPRLRTRGLLDQSCLACI